MRRALASSLKGPLVRVLDMEKRRTLSISSKCLESLSSSDGLHRTVCTWVVEIGASFAEIPG